MNEPNRESTPTPSASMLQRLFSRRQWPKYLFAIACLATLAVLIITIESRRGLHAQPGAASALPATAELDAAKKMVPPTVPDDQNFVAIPFFQSLFDKTIDTGPSQWPDDFSRADQWPRRIPTLAESTEGRKTGRLPYDLVAWKKSFDYAFDINLASDVKEEIAVSDQPDPTANAHAALAVLEALKPYEPALMEVQAARQRPYARFNVAYNWDDPWAILLPHLAVIKRTSQLLRLKSCAELAAGHSEQALQDVLLMLRLIESLKDEPFLISHLVRVASLEIAFQPIWEGLAQRRWSEPQLQSLQEALQQINFIADLDRVLKAERTWANLSIALIRDKRTPDLFSRWMTEDGKIEPWQEEANRDLVKAPRDWFDLEQRNYNQLFDGRLLRGFDIAARRVYPRVVDENIHLLEQALRNRDAAFKEHRIFATALLGALGRVHLKLAGTQGYTDLAVVACALERHRLVSGQFPESLDALSPRFLDTVPRDLINGEPLHYQRTDDGQFLLYSVGWNEIDDGGELAFFASGRGPEKKGGDWVWRYPAR